MQRVKTYQNIDAKKEQVNFSISKMEAIYVHRNGKTDEPHRHNYYTVLIIHEAKGLHKIDFKSYDLGKRQIFFVAPGQVHQVLETNEPRGFVMTFSNSFLIENSIPLSFIDRLNLFQNYGQTPPLLPSEEQFNVIENFSREIFELFVGDARMKNLSMGAFLKLLLIECNNICAVNPTDSDSENSGDTIIRDFKHAVDSHYKKEHSAIYYADSLHVTADHLSRILKSKIGKTAKEYIQARIITEAKRLLYFTDLSTKEIGYELGFNEPANFSAFFKKCTELSPSHFKKNEKKS